MTNDQNRPSRRHDWRGWLDTFASTALIVACGTLVWVHFIRTPERTAPPEVPPPTEPLPLLDAVSMGDPHAPLALLEFSEFECPFCARFHAETFTAIRDKYINTGRVLFVFRHFPLTNIHPTALPASVAAQCAGTQGRFWSMHDALFASQPIAPNMIQGLAAELGLNLDSFNTCLNAPAATEQVLADLELGKRASVVGTPTFLLGRRDEQGHLRATRRLRGALPFEQFESAIEELLSDNTVAERQ